VNLTNWRVCDASGRTKLHWAAYKNDWDDVPAELFGTEDWLRLDLEGGSPFALAVATGRVEFLPRTLFTKENLCKVFNSEVPLQSAARQGGMRHLPSWVFADENIMLAEDQYANTGLHWAAFYGWLHLVPAVVLSRENLLRENKFGYTVAHSAAHGGSLGSVPLGIVGEMADRRTALGESFVFLAANSGKLDKLPPSLVTVESLMCCSTDAAKVHSDDLTISFSSGGLTALHVAAIRGKLGQLPAAVLAGLTEAHLSVRSQSHDLSFNSSDKDMDSRCVGWTVLGAAARVSNLKAVPAALVTVDRLLDRCGANTPMHIAAASTQLGDLPDGIVSSLVGEQLMMRSARGNTVLHAAVEGGSLDYFLGVSLPEAAKDIVGDDWWEKNCSIIRDKGDLGVESEGAYIDLF